MAGGDLGTLPLFALLATALAAGPLAGQWRLDAQAGHLQYEAAPDPAATSLGVGLGYRDFESEFGVSTGVPLSGDGPVWGAIFGSRRIVAPGTVSFGIDLGGQAFGYRVEPLDTLPVPPLTDAEAVTGWGASAEAMPLIAWSNGRFAAEARAGGVHFLTRGGGSDGYDRSALLADASFSVRPTPALRLTMEGAAARVAEGTYPYAGIGFTWSPSLALWGSVGRWLSDDLAGTSWAAGLSLPMGDRVAVQVSGRHDPVDPIYATPARTSWGAGVSVMLGEAASVARPVPASYEGGVATIELDDDDVDGVPSIAGDFNSWEPAPMTRRGGDWILEVALEPGVYNYAFVDEDGNWFVPEDTPGRRNDGMGGHVAVLVVE